MRITVRGVAGLALRRRQLCRVLFERFLRSPRSASCWHFTSGERITPRAGPFAWVSLRVISFLCASGEWAAAEAARSFSRCLRTWRAYAEAVSEHAVELFLRGDGVNPVVLGCGSAVTFSTLFIIESPIRPAVRALHGTLGYVVIQAMPRLLGKSAAPVPTVVRGNLLSI